MRNSVGTIQAYVGSTHIRFLLHSITKNASRKGYRNGKKSDPDLPSKPALLAV